MLRFKVELSYFECNNFKAKYNYSIVRYEDSGA